MEIEQPQVHAAAALQPADDKVHLAMGDDVRQCLFSLRWAMRNVLPHITLVLVHIYRPATVIPTRFGALMPVSLLNDQIVGAYITHERENIDKVLEEYVKICAHAKVKVEKLVAENDHVAAGLLDLIIQHQITTLIMGSVKNRINGLKSKLSTTLEEQADPSCNILFLQHGNLISSRQENDNVYMIGTYDLPSSRSLYGLSGSSNYTSSTLSSWFRNSFSTGSGFDVTQLDDTFLENAASIFDDTRFSVISGHDSLSVSKDLAIDDPNSVEKSQDQVFHAKCIEILTRCQFIGGIDLVPGVDCKDFEEDQWKSIKSWPAAVENIVRVLSTILMQPKQNIIAKVLSTKLLKQKSRECSCITNYEISEAAKESIRQLLHLASKVAKVKKSPEKLFHILHMHRALSDATPTLARAFDVEFVKKEIDGVVVALNDSALTILHELKVLVQTYSPKKVPTEGSILTITGYVMKYIRLLVNHARSLDTILYHGQASDLLSLEGMNLTGRLASGLIADLESVLEETSSSYASEGFRCLFLMNNAHFILQEVEQSDIRLMVGPQWIKRYQYNIKRYMRDYLSSSWKEVVSPLETATTPSPKKLRNNFLKIFYPTPSPLRSFESALNRTCKAQMHWKVPARFFAWSFAQT